MEPPGGAGRLRHLRGRHLSHVLCVNSGVPLAGAARLWSWYCPICWGLIGGVLGGLTFEKVPVRWLKVIFGLFLLYGGVRYLLW